MEPENDYGPVYDRFTQVIPTANFFEQKDFRAFMGMFPEKWLNAALDVCENKNVRNFSYFEAVIKNLARNGGPSSEEDGRQEKFRKWVRELVKSEVESALKEIRSNG